MTGTLHGVGLGPGAPDLLTLRAARLIECARVVAYPAPLGGDSFARSIAAAHIADDAREIRIDVPMTTARQPAQAAYDAGAVAIAEALGAGHDVVCLCEGDPMLYGSFMYVAARLRDRFPVRVTPGITSVTACAAAAAWPLAARDAVLTILPATLPDEDLRARIDAADAVALMKVGRHLPRLRALLDGMGLTATYVERATLDGQVVRPLAQAPDRAPYFSMLLIAKGADPWT
ncbi:precorrin-2 C(20)-methyltransferase [Jannaschia sp. LMIT008]|uniref:precorrin-2 C(20)-methyltransferase n=1 Tax=Jannaschia maritima TaxID=3032585 RepID=UPI0028120C43|nr:precorrin-2 C(20)-methyltransferase [Jannaschia sp. LMIT008]